MLRHIHVSQQLKKSMCEITKSNFSRYKDEGRYDYRLHRFQRSLAAIKVPTGYMEYGESPKR